MPYLPQLDSPYYWIIEGWQDFVHGYKACHAIRDRVEYYQRLDAAFEQCRREYSGNFWYNEGLKYPLGIVRQGSGGHGFYMPLEYATGARNFVVLPIRTYDGLCDSCRTPLIEQMDIDAGTAVYACGPIVYDMLFCSQVCYQAIVDRFILNPTKHLTLALSKPSTFTVETCIAEITQRPTVQALEPLCLPPRYIGAQRLVLPMPMHGQTRSK